jgi:hypothetical protein
MGWGGMTLQAVRPVAKAQAPNRLMRRNVWDALILFMA